MDMENSLTDETLFYWSLNCKMGKFRLEDERIPMGLWPWIFARMKKQHDVRFLHFFVSRKIELFASVRPNNGL